MLLQTTTGAITPLTSRVDTVLSQGCTNTLTTQCKQHSISLSGQWSRVDSIKRQSFEMPWAYRRLRSLVGTVQKQLQYHLLKYCYQTVPIPTHRWRLGSPPAHRLHALILLPMGLDLKTSFSTVLPTLHGGRGAHSSWHQSQPSRTGSPRGSEGDGAVGTPAMWGRNWLTWLTPAVPSAPSAPSPLHSWGL